MPSILSSVKDCNEVLHAPPTTTAAWDAWQSDDSATTAVQHAIFAGATNKFAAVMQETSANSLLFAATYCFESETASHPVILSTGTVEGTPPGYIEPFIAKIVSPTLSDSALTNLLSAKGWTFNLHGEPMRVVEVEGFGLCLADAAGASDEPRVFTALADRAGTVPAQAWGELRITFELASTNGTALVEYDSWITDPSFADDGMQALAAGYSAPPPFVGPPLQFGGGGMLMSAASASSPADWTAEDAWAMFEVLFGENGSKTRELYCTFGLVVKREINGLFSGSYSIAKGGEEIVLDAGMANAVDAALALRNALRHMDKTVWADYTDYRSHMMYAGLHWGEGSSSAHFGGNTENEFAQAFLNVYSSTSITCHLFIRISFTSCRQ